MSSRAAAREGLQGPLHVPTELLRGRFADRRQRRRVLREAMEAYRLLVEVCLDIGRIDENPTAWAEAAEVAEASRSRALMDLLAEQELSPANALPELVEEFRRLRKNLRDATLRLEMEEEQEVRLSESSGSRTIELSTPKENRSVVRTPQLLERYYRTPKSGRREYLVAEAASIG